MRNITLTFSVIEWRNLVVAAVHGIPKLVVGAQTKMVREVIAGIAAQTGRFDADGEIKPEHRLQMPANVGTDKVVAVVTATVANGFVVDPMEFRANVSEDDLLSMPVWMLDELRQQIAREAFLTAWELLTKQALALVTSLTIDMKV